MKDSRTRFEDNEADIDNDLMKKILEDRTRLRERAKTMDIQVSAYPCNDVMIITMHSPNMQYQLF